MPQGGMYWLLGYAIGLSTLNAKGICSKVVVAEEKWDKTAVLCHCSIFCFPRVPFRLKNARGTFNGALELQLTKVKCGLSLVSFDGRAILLRTPDKDVDHARQISMILYDVGVILNLETLILFRNLNDDLDHLMTLVMLLAIVHQMFHVKKWSCGRTQTHHCSDGTPIAHAIMQPSCPTRTKLYLCSHPAEREA